MAKRWLFGAIAVQSASVTWSQNELGEIGVRGPGLSESYILYAIGGLTIFLLFLVFVILKRRLGSSDKFEPAIGMSVTDVSSLKAKGLLTEEESKAVRAAMARQMSKQLETKTTGKISGAQSLLVDPEVLRLQAIAEARKAAPPAPVEESEVHPAAASFDSPPAFAATDWSDILEPEKERDDDVQLPPDVMTMAQLGLITPEELEAIKERARARKKELNQ